MCGSGIEDFSDIFFSSLTNTEACEGGAVVDEDIKGGGNGKGATAGGVEEIEELVLAPFF